MFCSRYFFLLNLHFHIGKKKHTIGTYTYNYIFTYIRTYVYLHFDIQNVNLIKRLRRLFLLLYWHTFFVRSVLRSCECASPAASKPHYCLPSRCVNFDVVQQLCCVYGFRMRNEYFHYLSYMYLL